ncbi:hypothetical protein SCE1572_30650 [Sorangium cellulosum So0157-2]|uniref:HipA-like C-terminal domain-containing protein n=1 Tax=Sorangium cellulosum So0157-2 TaxID=1254432 RepID=S4Y1X8_SORCE|nr:hypothetical protein SCE1572_30650 [Sorangium cellulosum So0157-2]
MAYDELPALRGAHALAITRFDRQGERRIHQEDFAQIFAVEPEDKYAERSSARRASAHRFESVAAVLHAIDRASSREFVRRLVFMILSGNEDAHLKNWSLLYDEQGIGARLSPAYDLVCTIAYQGNPSPRLALRIGGGHEACAVRIETFKTIAIALGESPEAVHAWVREDVARILDCFAANHKDWPLPSFARDALLKHHGRVALRQHAGS